MAGLKTGFYVGVGVVVGFAMGATTVNYIRNGHLRRHDVTPAPQATFSANSAAVTEPAANPDTTQPPKVVIAAPAQTNEARGPVFTNVGHGEYASSAVGTPSQRQEPVVFLHVGHDVYGPEDVAATEAPPQPQKPVVFQRLEPDDYGQN